MAEREDGTRLPRTTPDQPQARHPSSTASTPTNNPPTPTATLTIPPPPPPPPSTTTTTTLPLIPLSPTTLPPHPTEPPSLTTARLLQLLLTNGLSTATHLPRPYTLAHLTTLRTQLLRAPFFDPLHRPSELRPRIRPQRILFMDLVVLVARLLRVMMRREPLGTAAEREERVEVRNGCFDEPFFDRSVEGGWGPEGPFGGAGEGVGEDEGCFI